ncbi:MAG TPA: RNA-binding protein [Chthoniobacteraceae bacterium]|jgi:RNA recognition motif-containing protein|nr:RNA-binding protein [Chthoniobacteraceae bacterium]
MKSQDSRHSGRRSGRGSRRSSSRPRQQTRSASPAPAKLTIWQWIKRLFAASPKPAVDSRTATPSTNGSHARPQARQARKPEAVEVTSAKLYVGNLSFDATESDLFELFKGVGAVRNAEIVTNKFNEKSKGFGFVMMSSVDEAKRAVVELHDKEFLGRKLVVSGAKSGDREPNYRG